MELTQALARVRSMVLSEGLVRAVAAGRRKGQSPRWRRAEFRYVDLKAGRHLQITTYDQTQAHVSNHAPGGPAAGALDALLAEPFGNWHVDTTTETLQIRVTKKGDAVTSTSAANSLRSPRLSHDRQKPRLLPEDDPVLVALGISDVSGKVKPSRQAKYRQVEEFLRAVGAALDDLPPPTGRPLAVVDLGCGNAYLTFAAHRFLTEVRGLDVRMTGIDVKAQALAHNTALAERLSLEATLDFVRAPIAAAAIAQAPDLVLALHACDTASDDALAAAVTWSAPMVLAAPCCHHDIAAQLRRTPAPAPYAMLTRDGILRERFADTLTDALRAAVLRQVGYRVEVMEFVESKHTPRNTLIRAIRTGGEAQQGSRDELDQLMATWRVRPRLAELLHDRLV